MSNDLLQQCCLSARHLASTWGSSNSDDACALVLQAIDRRERLRRLALETIDLSKDPYFMRNHLGQYECRLCLTLHNNEGNYLAHTQVSLRDFFLHIIHCCAGSTLRPQLSCLSSTHLGLLACMRHTLLSRL